VTGGEVSQTEKGPRREPLASRQTKGWWGNLHPSHLELFQSPGAESGCPGTPTQGPPKATAIKGWVVKHAALVSLRALVVRAKLSGHSHMERLGAMKTCTATA
jgi:hypothetical protein